VPLQGADFFEEEAMSSMPPQPAVLSSTAPLPRADAPRLGWAWPSLVVFAVLLGVWVYRYQPYTPGSDFGYYMGLVGGVLMLLLLLYPLRKHVRALHTLGPARYWFRMHMALGILGPTLVLYHSTFHLGSINATVALTCMVLVAGSGVFGRFLYRHIHHGLYGRKATLAEFQTELGMRSGDMKSKFHFAPQVEERLKQFEAWALASGRVGSRVWCFFALPTRMAWARWQCQRELGRVLGAHARKRDWAKEKLARRLDAANQMIRDYFELVQNTAQFHTYERLFSLWHIAHVPFVYMLVLSGVFHVIAVHMY
jgi:hypothetical protein